MALQHLHSLPETAITQAVELILWAQLELLGAYGAKDIAYCRRVLERRRADYRRLMGHPEALALQSVKGVG